jgi:GT2 family glycosyltransferase
MTFAEIYIETANKALVSKGIGIESALQCTPRFIMPEHHKEHALNFFSKFPRPWVILCPRSASHNHRTVHDAVWQEAARHIDGTCFWAGNHGLAPAGIQNLNCNSMLEVGQYQAAADLVVSVDSGPLHLAAALGTPIVALLQSSSPELHLSDQNDFEILAPEGLNCLNCQQSPCPINEHYPPCQSFRPEMIAMIVNKKLRRFRTEEVSAVVTIYKPPYDRLNKCLSALLPQVSEIIVTRNADGVIPVGAMQHPKIRYVATRLPNIGYGRNANYGARHTSDNYILFLNDDVYLNPDTVSHLLGVIKQDPKIGMVGHLLRYPDNRVQHAGTRRQRHDLGWGHVSHRMVTPEIQTIVECENVTHASVLMRRKAFYEAGTYDERFFMYYEDNCLNLCMRKVGWKIFYTPHASGIHDEHQTLQVYENARMVDNARRSRALFEKLWGPYFRNNKESDGISKLGSFDYAK